MTPSPDVRRILGIPFFVGDLEDLLDLSGAGGLIVVPSAPVLVDMTRHEALRQALERSDLALTDSGFFVLLWHLFKRERLRRISGLKFLRALLLQRSFRRRGASFWVMPSPAAAETDRRWLSRQGIAVGADDCYVAPQYPEGPLADPGLVDRLEAARPAYVVLCLGGGVQERLGLFLRDRLSFRPAIVCTGAAIAFLSGQQARIPPWADRLFLGWLLRTLDDPTRFIPRYWKSLALVRIVRRA
jgi:UDP-N-acetyl-D-mannosaminuronic acid transferase (WecB/TagA/CpsF family)